MKICDEYIIIANALMVLATAQTHIERVTVNFLTKNRVEIRYIGARGIAISKEYCMHESIAYFANEFDTINSRIAIKLMSSNNEN